MPWTSSPAALRTLSPTRSPPNRAPIADLATVREVTGIGDEVDDATLQEAADAVCLGTYSDPAEMSDATGLRSDQAPFLMGEGAFEFCGA